MTFWILAITDYTGERVNEVTAVLFDESLIEPKLAELFAEDQDIRSIKVETWFREPNGNNASFYDYEVYCRDDMNDMR